MISRYPYRIVTARWTKTKSPVSFTSTIKISGIDDIGIVNQIAETIALYSVTMRNFSYTMEDGLFEGTLSLLVPNNDVLYSIIKKIQHTRGILKVSRQNS